MFVKSLAVPDPTSFRLIRIQTGADECPLHLTIYKASFKKARYFCLSYTWQPHGPAHNVFINEKPVSIGHNLWLFLCSARSAGLDTPLWIDALCINQNDLQERNRVVSRMGDIYANAERVLIWLSKLRRNLQLFFTELQKTESLLIS